MNFKMVELDLTAEQNVTCPICQHAVIDWLQEQYVQPCEHTLFIAFDLGFEYVSDPYEATLARSVDEIHAHDDQINLLEDLKQSSLTDYVIHRSAFGMPGMYRYIGFKA